ncbi:MAG: hypothetical protein LRY55_00940 [Leadbetterella sp.]|nr:hypothetical protein [Leadbetterella sp.]
MKNILYPLVLVALMTACENDEAGKVTLFEPGKLEASASTTGIKFGETITYTDLSTKVHRRNWIFPGGTPGSSTDSVVSVTYAAGGSFKAVLNVVFIDNQKGQYSFDVEVEKDPDKEIPDYDYGKTFGLYTEMPSITPGISSVMAIDMNQFPPTRVSDALEGVEAFRFAATGSSDWAMAALQQGNGQPINISAFEKGYYNVALKSECQANILLRVRSNGGGNAIFTFTAAGEEYGFKRDGRWHLVSIPVADIRAKDPNLNLSQVTDFLLFRSAPGDVRTIDNYVFYVDHVFLSEKVELKNK